MMCRAGHGVLEHGFAVVAKHRSLPRTFCEEPFFAVVLVYSPWRRQVQVSLSSLRGAAPFQEDGRGGRPPLSLTRRACVEGTRFGAGPPYGPFQPGRLNLRSERLLPYRNPPRVEPHSRRVRCRRFLTLLCDERTHALFHTEVIRVSVSFECPSHLLRARRVHFRFRALQAMLDYYTMGCLGRKMIISDQFIHHQ